MDTRGLVDKYQVQRNDGRPLKGGGAIVLEVGDPKTWPAIARLAVSVEVAGNVTFARGLRAMLFGVGAFRSPEVFEENTLSAAMRATLEKLRDLRDRLLKGEMTPDQISRQLTAAALCRIQELRERGMPQAFAEEEALSGALIAQRWVMASVLS